MAQKPTPKADADSAPAFTPSKLVSEALGEHAQAIDLVQGDGEPEIEFAVRCIETIGSVLSETLAQNIDLKRSLAAQKGQVTKARNVIEELEEAARPRDLGPMAAVFGDEAETFTPVDIMTAIDSAEEVVLAFSDGRHELTGIRPRKVSPSDFRLTRGQVVFTRSDLEIMAPGGEGSPQLTLAGVALLIDGEQAAWSPMSRPMALGGGQTLNLTGSVVFS